MYLVPLVIVSLILAGIIFAKPFWGLIIFTALLYLRPGDFFPIFESLHIVRIIAAVTFFATLLQKKEMFVRPLSGHRQIVYLTVLIIVVMVSIITSIWRSNSLDHFLTFIKIYPAFLMIIVLVDSLKKMRKVIWIMVLLVLCIVIQSIVTGNYVETYRMRGIGKGMFGDPNDLALCFIMHIPFIIYLLKGRGGAVKKLFLVGVLLMLLQGIILTHSRGGLIGLLVVVCLLFLKSENKIKMLIGLGVFVTIFVLIAPISYKERMMSITTSYKEDESSISRIDAWRAGLAMMKHNVLGVGIGNFGEAFVKYRPANAVDVPGMRRAPHNALVQVGGETGILGLVMFVLLFFSAFGYLRKIKKSCLMHKTKECTELMQYADALYISLAGFLSCALFLSQAYNWFLYYLFAYSVVLMNIEKKLCPQFIK